VSEAGTRVAAAVRRGVALTGTPAARSGPVGVLDVGTSKVCCYVVRARPGGGQGGAAELLGRGYQLAEGLRAGEVVDAEAAETSILAVVHEAEQQAGLTLRDLVVAVGGCQPRSSWHRLSLQLGGRAVAEGDVGRLLDRGRAEAAASGRAVLHMVPLEVGLDGGGALRDARGLVGQHLDVLAHAVSVASGPLGNILACLDRCHIGVRGVVAASYAAGLACLAEDERERGCLLVDMGGGSTSLAHFAGGRLALVEQVPYGGEHVTRDLAWGLSTGRQHAERIKNLFGGVQWRSCDDNTRIEVPLFGDHPELPTGEVPRTRITQIIRARIEEIFLLAQDKLREHVDFLERQPPRSMVLTGGASQLEGIDELAQEMFGIPVRRGRPELVEGANGFESEPCCATASGAAALSLGEGGGDGIGWGEAGGLALPASPLVRVGRWLRQSF
jgi:cell division protein FtsA